MVNLNLTIVFIQMIGFVTLLFILNIILYKPVLRVLRKRKETLDSMIGEAEQKRAKAQENERLYFQKLAEAEDKAKEEYKKIISEASYLKEKTLDEERKKAKEEFETQKRELENALENEKEAALKYSEELSETLYNQLVG